MTQRDLSATTAQPFEDHGTSREASWYDIHHRYDSSWTTIYEYDDLDPYCLNHYNYIQLPTVLPFPYLHHHHWHRHRNRHDRHDQQQQQEKLREFDKYCSRWFGLRKNFSCNRNRWISTLSSAALKASSSSQGTCFACVNTHFLDLWKVSKVSSDLMPRSFQSYKSYTSSLRFQPAWTWNQWIKPRLRTSQSPHDAQSSHGLWGFNTRPGRILIPTKTYCVFLPSRELTATSHWFKKKNQCLPNRSANSQYYWLP